MLPSTGAHALVAEALALSIILLHFTSGELSWRMVLTATGTQARNSSDAESEGTKLKTLALVVSSANSISPETAVKSWMWVKANARVDVVSVSFSVGNK